MSASSTSPRDVGVNADHAPPLVAERERWEIGINGNLEHPARQRPLQGVRLFVGAGRRAGVRPSDLVGAIAGETGVPARALGAIEIADTFSLVSVPEELADEIIGGMKKATLRGQPVKIRRDREGSVPVRR